MPYNVNDSARKVSGCIYTCSFLYLVGVVGGIVAFLIESSDYSNLVYLIIIALTLLLAILLVWYEKRLCDKRISEIRNKMHEWANRAIRAERELKKQRHD